MKRSEAVAAARKALDGLLPPHLKAAPYLTDDRICEWLSSLGVEMEPVRLPESIVLSWTEDGDEASWQFLDRKTFQAAAEDNASLKLLLTEMIDAYNASRQPK